MVLTQLPSWPNLALSLATVLHPPIERPSPGSPIILHRQPLIYRRFPLRLQSL